MFGEEALPYFSNANTLVSFNKLLSEADIAPNDKAFRHRQYSFSVDDGKLQIGLNNEKGDKIYAASLIAMFVNKLKNRTITVYNSNGNDDVTRNYHFAFAIPPAASVHGSSVTNSGAVHTSTAGVGVLDACYIAAMNNINHNPINNSKSTAHVYNSVDCIVAAYTRRINALRTHEKQDLIVSTMCAYMGICTIYLCICM